MIRNGPVKDHKKFCFLNEIPFLYNVNYLARFFLKILTYKNQNLNNKFLLRFILSLKTTYPK